MRNITELLNDEAREGASQYGSAPLARHIRFDFDAGLPDPATYPIDDLVRLAEQTLRADPAAALHYGRENILYGFDGLREQLAERAGVGPEQILLTSGGAQAISLAFDAVSRPGAPVALEAPTWGYALRQVGLDRARAIVIPTDGDGLCVDVLDAEARRLRIAGTPLRAVYVISNFSVPTGVSLSLERRRALVALAARERFTIIEDNTYGALRYDGAPMPTLLELDDAGVVLSIDSFSKVIAPGLRLGWVTGDAGLIAGLAAMRRDLGVSQWIARIVSAFIDEGLLDPHLARVRALYGAKRDRVDAALHEHGASRLRWRRPEGGFFYWLEIIGDVDPAAVMRNAASRGIACRPGERFFGDPADGADHMRLAFSMYPEAELDAGISALGEVLRTS